MIDWNDLRYLLAVARTGRTSAAARALGVNQSTVVRRVAALEAGLGLRLFDKRRDGYRLTPAGAALLEDADAVEASVAAFARRAASLDDGLDGSLRVTTAGGIALRLMPPLLEAFHRRHPRLRVKLLIEDEVRDLGDGHADVALRAGTPRDETLIGRKLADQCWALYGSADYVAHHGEPTAPADLADHHLVALDPPLQDVKAGKWLREVAPDAAIACSSGSVLGLLFAAKSGAGLALLPCHIGDPEPGLVRVMDLPAGRTSDLWILTHADLHRTPKVRAFFDFMAAEIERYRPMLLGRIRPRR